MNRFVVVMGVSGVGKTSVGVALAERLGWPFYDADDFHPDANVAKMASGAPLDDADRAPWLTNLRELIAAHLTADRPGVLACSALKQSYRDTLASAGEGVAFVFLTGSAELIEERMRERHNHYMKPGMLASQFAALEPPAGALTIEVTAPVAQIVERVAAELGLAGARDGWERGRGGVMHAIVVTGRGSSKSLELAEVAKPVPKEREVLIRVRAATVTSGDVIMRNLSPLLRSLLRLFGFRSKQIPGHEFAGEVEAVGTDVEHFEVGDQLFGTTTGLRVGANAEYLCVPERWSKGVMAVKPANLSFGEAAALPIGGMAALSILRKGRIESGHKVLVYGASGSVGSYAVQIAKHLGAEVTGVSSTANLELVASLGADHVIDYRVEEVGGGDARYHVIFDAVGKTSRAHLGGALEKGGRYLTVKSLTSEELDDLIRLRELAEAGAIRPVIDRRYPLAQTAEAYRYVAQGHKRGNVVITV